MAAGAHCWWVLGQVFRELDQYDDAVEAFQQVLLLAPGDAETWHRMGVVLLLLRRDAEALTAFRRSLQLDTAQTKARFNLATLIRRDSPAEAALHLSVLWRQDPDLASLLEGQLCDRRGA